MFPKTLIVIYNADASLRGKVVYAVRKLRSSSNDESPCAACDITHGGLSLTESVAWKNASANIKARGVEIVQWHRDEVERDVRAWAKENGVRYPVVLAKGLPVDGNAGDNGHGELRVVLDSAELAQCAGQAEVFVTKLERKGILEGENQGNESGARLAAL